MMGFFGRIKLYYMYESDPLDPVQEARFANNIMIRRDEWIRASFIVRRMALHRLLVMCYKHDPAETEDIFPEPVLANDLEQLKSCGVNCWHRGYFDFRPRMKRRFDYNRILSHFFNYRPSCNKWVMLRALNYVTRIPNIPITVTTVRKYIRQHMTRQFNPVSYAAFLRYLSIKGSVIDLYPDMGHKLVACAILGLHYITPRTDAMQRAIDLGVERILGLSHEWLDRQAADLLISDQNFSKFDISETEPMLERVRMMLAFAPVISRIALQEQYEPRQVIPVRVAMLCGQPPDFIFVW
jgi:hypothetical protein